jgi:hypothetical protein
MPEEIWGPVMKFGIHNMRSEQKTRSRTTSWLLVLRIPSTDQFGLIRP